MNKLAEKYYPHSLFSLNERITELEHVVLKGKKRTDTTRAQQMLLLHHIGVLQPILDLGLTQTKTVNLLSVLLNSSPDNLKKDLATLNQKDSEIKNASNYRMLVKTFQDLGMKKLERECQIELDRILKRDESK
jgi:hypothetical protein